MSPLQFNSSSLNPTLSQHLSTLCSNSSHMTTSPSKSLQRPLTNSCTLRRPPISAIPLQNRTHESYTLTSCLSRLPGLSSLFSSHPDSSYTGQLVLPNQRSGGFNPLPATTHHYHAVTLLSHSLASCHKADSHCRSFSIRFFILCCRYAAMIGTFLSRRARSIIA